MLFLKTAHFKYSAKWAVIANVKKVKPQPQYAMYVDWLTGTGRKSMWNTVVNVKRGYAMNAALILLREALQCF